MQQARLRKQQLRELAAFEISGPFEDNLYRLTCIAGELLAARRVSLLLRDVSPGKGACLKLAALYGELPPPAWRAELEPGQGIAGAVLANGKTIRVADIHHSSWKNDARRPGQDGACMICPIVMSGRPAGVLNVSEPLGRAAFTRADQDTAELAALLIGRVIQVARLGRLLDSRFAQMAFTLEGAGDACSVVSLSAHDPDRVARMLAKAFYREMRHCGFTPNQIIHAAGEIISELTGSLNRHKKRIGER